MRYVIVQSVLLVGLVVTLLRGSGSRLLPDDRWIAACGMVLCLTAVVLVGAAFWSLKSAFRMAPAPRQQVRLVQGGIYAHLRHPMYTAAISMVAGLFMLHSTWETAALALAITVFYVIKARHEEGLLSQHYPEYRAYQQRSRGVIPLR